MSLNYELLGETAAQHLRRQRLLDLEADHFRLVLDVEETPDGVEPSASILEKISDVERRINLHREALGMEVGVHRQDTDPASAEIPAG